MNVARDPVRIRGRSQYTMGHNRSMERTANRVYICPQQHLPESSVLTLPSLKIARIEFRIVMFEVHRPAIQLPENVVQTMEKVGPVLPHPNSTKVLPN